MTMHEKMLIENFVSTERQERYLNLLQTKNGRVKLRKYIAHFKDLNPNFIKQVHHLQTAAELRDLLESKGAIETCYIISEHSKYDANSMPLQEATDILFNSGIAYFLSCIPGQLAYYEGEENNQRFLLQRSQS
jgi:hypothetical protein